VADLLQGTTRKPHTGRFFIRTIREAFTRRRLLRRYSISRKRIFPVPANGKSQILIRGGKIVLQHLGEGGDLHFTGEV